MTGTTKRLARLSVAVIFVVPVILGSLATSSTAAPSKADVEAAEAKADEIGARLEVVVEQYNEARVQLSAIQEKLVDMRDEKAQADAEVQAATEDLEARAVEAYTGAGSQLDVLLGAENFTEFSDRLEFMGAVAQNDADLAAAATSARQRAEWAAQEYAKAVGQQKDKLDAMDAQRADIEGMLAEQEALADQLGREYRDYLARQQAAAAAAAASAAADQSGGTTPPSGTPPTTPPSDFDPPPVGVGASAAIAAARSVLGTAYVWGAADPGVGFDCSGLTMYAWAHGGVSLPHSSASQASAGTVIPTSSMAAGDLLFFYSPISHVALYIGGGMMIHARHPGPGGQVQIGSVSGYGTPVVRVVRVG
ncbi:MAG TPA: NlpC/P60 family protein [Actinomycetota bacterium]